MDRKCPYKNKISLPPPPHTHNINFKTAGSGQSDFIHEQNSTSK